MRRTLLLCLCALAAGYVHADGGWDPLRYTNAPVVTDGPVSRALMEEILVVVQRARALDRPQGFRVGPRVEFTAGSPLQDGSTGLPTATLSMPMSFGVANDPLAGLQVRINDPSDVLGPELLSDEEGAIYVLPPTITGPGNQTLFLRSAHPAGFRSEFPTASTMPLWGQDQGPFYRSVIRPHFGLLANSAVTILSRGDRRFWVPISQERWILALIARGRSELDGFLAGAHAAERTGMTDRQIDQIRRTYAQLSAMWDESAILERYQTMVEQAQMQYQSAKHFGFPDPESHYDRALAAAEVMLEQFREQAPAMRAEMESQEARIVGALVMRGEFLDHAERAISARRWDDLEALGNEYDLPNVRQLADAGRTIDALEVELSGLSRSERHAAAYGFELPPIAQVGLRNVVALEFDRTRPSGLVSPDAPGARALVSIDPTFFARPGSPQAPALVTVLFWQKTEPWDVLRRRGVPHAEGATMHSDVWSTLDWAALRSIVAR